MKKAKSSVSLGKHMYKYQEKWKTLIAVGALGYAMYGEGALSVDCYACASDFAQAQYAAKPFAATILNNPVLLDGTKIFKGPKGTVSSITYDYLHEEMAYTNKFIVQTKNIDNIGVSIHILF